MFNSFNSIQCALFILHAFCSQPFCVDCVFVVSVRVGYIYSERGALAMRRLEGGDMSFLPLSFYLGKLCSRIRALLCNTRVGKLSFDLCL